MTTNDNLLSVDILVAIAICVDICSDISVDMYVKQYHKFYEKLDKVNLRFFATSTMYHMSYFEHLNHSKLKW